jgi:hypothetical protein
MQLPTNPKISIDSMTTMLEVTGGATLLAAVDCGAAVGLRKHRRETLDGAAQSFSGGAAIRTPPVTHAAAQPLGRAVGPTFSPTRRIWMRLLRGYLVMTVCMVVVEVAPMTLPHRAGVASPAASSQVGRRQNTADRMLQRYPGLIPMHPRATSGDLPPVHTRLRLATVPHQSGLALRLVFEDGSISHVDTEFLLNG